MRFYQLKIGFVGVLILMAMNGLANENCIFVEVNEIKAPQQQKATHHLIIKGY